MERVVYIWRYINAAANSVVLQLYLRHDFYDVVFKIKRKLYIASGSAPPPKKKSWCPHDVHINNVLV